jgi:hypothetical protein
MYRMRRSLLLVCRQIFAVQTSRKWYKRGARLLRSKRVRRGKRGELKNKRSTRIRNSRMVWHEWREG